MHIKLFLKEGELTLPYVADKMICRVVAAGFKDQTKLSGQLLDVLTIKFVETNRSNTWGAVRLHSAPSGITKAFAFYFSPTHVAVPLKAQRRFSKFPFDFFLSKFNL